MGTTAVVIVVVVIVVVGIALIVVVVEIVLLLFLCLFLLGSPYCFGKQAILFLPSSFHSNARIWEVDQGST